MKIPKKAPMIAAQKKTGKLNSKILIVLMVLYVLYSVFIKAKTIGHDDRYMPLIFWLPTLTGIIVLGIYRRKFLIATYNDAQGVMSKVLVVGFCLVQGFFFSYLSFGLAADFTWDYLNKQAAGDNPTEIIYCPVNQFWTGKNGKVYFEFENGTEALGMSHSDLDQYDKARPFDYKVKITVKKGLWNYYMVKDWYVMKR